MFSQEPMARIADFYVTGEASHHEQLDLVSRGATSVTAGHSNSERGYFAQRLQPWLQGVLAKELPTVGDATLQPIAITVSLADAEPGIIV